MLHSICTHRGQVNSRLLMVENQTASLTPGPSFCHNLCCRCPNGSCEAIFDIYTSIAFQWHEEHFKVRCFNPCNRTLKFWESQRTPKSSFRECECHPHTLPKVGSWHFTSQTFGDYNCSDCPIPLYGNNVTPPIMCPFSIPQPWSTQQDEITWIYHIILKYSKHNYVKNAMNIYFQISYQPHSFVVVWFTILRWYSASLSFGSLNLNLNCPVIILTPKLPSSNTSSIVFYPICT
jgi:hypothetical protein